ncbi:MAG: hypothetical protein K8R88_12395 [Armatimonadetes bacterium]|nr:hypothetical protein [Armatimonadota bacterium]
MEKWLFLRYRAIGDVIMAAWPITSVRLARPDAEFWFASEQGFESAIDDVRLVQHYYLLPRKKWKNARWNLNTWRDQLKFYTGLRHIGLDFGVDFQGHTKTALLLRLSGAKNRVQCNATDALSKRLNPVVTTTSVHKVDQMFETLARFGEFEKPKLPIMPIMTACPTDLRGRKLITINTGSSSPDKNYPLDGWREIASKLSQNGFAVAGVGGPADPPLELPGVEDFAGKLSFRESLSLPRHDSAKCSDP